MMSREREPNPGPHSEEPAPPLIPIATTAFKRDMKRLAARGKDLSKLSIVVELLYSRQTLPPRCRDHPLTGDWRGYRDCHIEPDWVLIYQLDERDLRLMRTGSHSDLDL